MFYCDECAAKNQWPDDFWRGQSRGACEVCRKVRACYDVPSSQLTARKPKPVN